MESYSRVFDLSYSTVVYTLKQKKKKKLFACIYYLLILYAHIQRISTVLKTKLTKLIIMS